MMPYNHTKFQVKTHQRAGSDGKKVQQNPEKPEKLNPKKEWKGTGVGDHFGTMRHISVTIDRTSPKLLW